MCSGTLRGAQRALQLVARRAVDVGGNLALMPVTGGRGSARLEHQDRAAGRRWFVLSAFRHHERVALPELDGGLGSRGVANRDLQLPVEDKEELVGVLVHV